MKDLASSSVFMKSFYAYIRVSTQKQGQFGVSLQEQRAAIERYAHKQGFSITQWFEERETAAKRGRPIFSQMLKQVLLRKAQGIIIHKIDRSARNLRDWADLRELADNGLEVHFATENLDLHTNDRRLSADIQAVVAAAYIDNLRQEAKKGFYGRLKQGVYPLPAPVGYLDCGAGKPKEPNPATAPLVRKAFELYATREYSITSLTLQLHNIGLRNRRGAAFSRSGIATMLTNPFYVGLINIHKTGETFRGAHDPIVSLPLFQRVQDILSGKSVVGSVRHDFVFRRMLKCVACGYSLVGDRKKGHVYYRCWRADCVTTSIREEAVEAAVCQTLQKIQLLPEELAELRAAIDYIISHRQRIDDNLRRSLDLQNTNLKARMDRLIDGYMDHMIEKDAFETRKANLLKEQVQLAEKLGHFDQNPHAIAERADRYFELAKSPHLSFISGLPEEKRKLLNEITSNRVVTGKSVAITLHFPFQQIADRPKYAYGGPYRAALRTLAWKLITADHSPARVLDLR